MRRALLATTGFGLLASFAGAGLPVTAGPSTAGTSPPPSEEVHVDVVDFRFDPSTVEIGRGDVVVFDFVGPSHHTATDSSGLALYDSGSVAAGGPSTSFEFEAAGVYPFACTPHVEMGGRVSVPVRVAPQSGGVRKTFTVTWASAEATGAHVYDVQVRRPGATWTRWRTGVTARTRSFTSDGGAGRYRFRARMRDVELAEASRWSEAVEIRVG